MFHPASDFRQYPARQIASAETLGIRGSRHISASYTGPWPPQRVAWNIGPEREHHWTILDDLPSTTDQ